MPGFLRRNFVFISLGLLASVFLQAAPTLIELIEACKKYLEVTDSYLKSKQSNIETAKIALEYFSTPQGSETDACSLQADKIRARLETDPEGVLFLRYCGKEQIQIFTDILSAYP